MFNSSVFGFQVISAQQLPKPEHDKPTSIVDPQVWVEVHGVPIDNNKKKTHHVNNNGESLSSAQLLLCSVVCVLAEAFLKSPAVLVQFRKGQLPDSSLSAPMTITTFSQPPHCALVYNFSDVIAD